MTKEKASKNQPKNKNQNKSSSKPFFLSLAFIAVAGAISYYSLIEYRMQEKLSKEIELENALNDYKKNNVQTSVIDIKEEYELGGKKEQPQLDSSSQSEIDKIKDQLSQIESQILQYSHNSNLLILYLEIRENFFSGSNHQNLLKDFKQIVKSDEFLSEKVSNLEELISTNLKPSSIKKDLNAAIPDLIAAKSITNSDDQSWIEDFKHRFRKLITVRKINQQPKDNDSFEIDFVIGKLERSIKSQDYKSAFSIISQIPEKYQKFLTRLKIHMEVLAQIKETDQEIINHLLKN